MIIITVVVVEVRKRQKNTERRRCFTGSSTQTVDPVNYLDVWAVKKNDVTTKGLRFDVQLLLTFV